MKTDQQHREFVTDNLEMIYHHLDEIKEATGEVANALSYADGDYIMNLSQNSRERADKMNLLFKEIMEATSEWSHTPFNWSDDESES